MSNSLHPHRHSGPRPLDPVAVWLRSDSVPRPLQRYAIAGHYQVQGWLSEIAILLLLDLARIQRGQGIAGPVCEIGVHHGRLLILLHHLTAANERSVGWDLFEHQDQNVDGSGKGDRARLMMNLRRHGADLSRIGIHTANSIDLTPADVIEACGGAPRIFSIDGGHTAAITESDLRLAAQSICDDGVIVVDDFFGEPWPGVAEGTCRYMAAPAVPLFPVVISGNKFVFTKCREMAELYQQWISMPVPPLRRRETIAFGQPVLVFSPIPTLPLRTRVARSPVVKAIRRSFLFRAAKRMKGR